MLSDTILNVYIIVMIPFGACIGSFLNVVIYRLPHNMSLLRPPSTCPKCDVAIKGYDNIPILSWFLLRGKCRACAAPISIRYPVVEASNAALWVGVAIVDWDLGFGMYENAGILALHLIFVSILLASSWIDIDYLIIPDEFTLGGTVLALVASALLPGLHYEAVLAYPASSPWMVSLLSGLFGAVVGAATLFLTGAVATIFLQKQIREAQKHDPEIDSAMGMGDVKLMALVGAVLGWQDVLLSFLVAIFLGAFIGCVLKYQSGTKPKGASGLRAVLDRFRSGNSAMPFGPYLCGGAALMLYFREPIREVVYHQIEPALQLFGYA